MNPFDFREATKLRKSELKLKKFIGFSHMTKQENIDSLISLQKNSEQGSLVRENVDTIIRNQMEVEGLVG